MWKAAWVGLLAWNAAFGQGLSPAQPSCRERLDEIKRLFAVHDPALLRIDILAQPCSDGELYQAAYYQGFAYYFLSRHEDALLSLQLARTLTGPWDEQVLYYIWKIQGRMGDRAGQEIALEDFRAAFPASRRLPEMDKAFRNHAFRVMALLGMGYSAGDMPYQGPKSHPFVSGSWSQENGESRFTESLNFSGDFSLDDRNQHYYGLTGGLEFEFHGFLAEAELGGLRSYYPRDSAGARNSRDGWEAQGSASLTQGFDLPGDWTASALAGYYQTGSSIASFSLGGDIDRYRAGNSLSLQLRGEYQRFDMGSGCVDLLGDFPRCESNLGLELYGDGARKWGRHSPGALFRIRFEQGLDSAATRKYLGTAGVQYGYQLVSWLKLSTRLEWGREWEAGRADGILRLVLNTLAYF